MILDTQTSLSRAQSIAAAAGDVASTDYYDTGAAHDAGIGEDLALQVQLNAAVTSGGAATVQVVLQSDDNSSFSSPKEYPLTAALALAALTAGAVLYRGKLPFGLERYLRIVYRIGTATTTGGTATAFLAKDLQVNPAYSTSVPGVK